MVQLSRRGFLQAAGTAGGGALAGGTISSLLSGRDVEQTAPSEESQQFFGTWHASPQPPYDSGISQEGFADETYRLMTRTSIGGRGLRLRFANTFSSDSLTLEEVSVGVRDSGASIEEGTLRTVTFGGDDSITIPGGGRVLSDSVSLSVEPEQDLATSVYISESTGPTTWHQLPTKTSYTSESGNLTGTALGSGFSEEFTHWFFLEGIEVINPDTVGSVVCLGNSITDGFNSTIHANAAYPDFLAERVNETESLRKSVLNAGISGNRILHDSPCCGVNALTRYDRDILAQPEVTDVILLEGINDIGFENFEDPQFAPPTSVSAEEIIDGMQQLIRRAHSHEVRIFGGTLTPFEGASYFYEEGEQKRQRVNEFIRTSGAFDGVIDFDRAIRDPSDQRQILSEFDSGDNLHPNDAGYEAMANEVNLDLLQQQEQGQVTG
jgi:lysophospholipase L1-like esterase